MDLTKIYTLWRSSRIEGWLMPDEPGIIYELAKKYIKKGSRVVEVGSWKGKSTYIIATICKKVDARLIAIDTFSGSIVENNETNLRGGAYYEAHKDPNKFFREHIAKNLKGFPVDYLKMTSRQAAKRIKNKSLDFCFLDGDHTLPVVYSDIKDYLPKVKKGGMLLGHDYSVVPNPQNQVKYSVDKLIGKDNIVIYSTIWTYIRN